MNLLLALFLTTIPFADTQKIAEKIWKNECGGSVEGLTHWKQGENFGSFGIGHFIWYPAEKKERFEETFPTLLLFLQKKGIELPFWLKNIKGCPWNTREEFYQDFDSSQMISLRKLLFDTKQLQALFIAERLEKALPDLDPSLKKVFDRLASDQKGLYALIDYLNFKGAGTSPSEAYQGQRWGLLQVLERISPTSRDLLSDFVASAKIILTQRVQNAPPERHEEQWLKGWLNRINTYLEGP